MRSLAFSLLPFVTSSIAQTPPIHVQNNTFNSSYRLSGTHQQVANLSQTVVSNVEIALNFERTNWVTGSVHEDPIYQPLPVNSTSRPGTLLKVEEYTNTNLYTLPPNVALSRFQYTTADLNGTTIPTTGYILWPWQAKSFPNSALNISGVPIVAWAHGTSGVFAECAPSHIRNLWYQYSAPYVLALQGYAVVAPDYAGLGIDHTSEGNPVMHPWLANPAAANDLIYAVEAAQTAFPELSKEFVVMGHSQGGGAAWAAAQRQVDTPAPGYLGAIAGSPVSDIIRNLAQPELQYAFAWPLAQGLASIFPEFTLSEWFEEAGVRQSELIRELSGCNSVGSQLFWQREGIVKQDWYDSWYLRAYRDLTANGHRPISGPLLVLQGTADQNLLHPVNAAVVNETCAMFPQSSIQYAAFEGVTHVPVMNAGQQIWLQWIEDRFMGKEAEKSCQWTEHRPLRKSEGYQKELAHYLQIAVESYTVV